MFSGREKILQKSRAQKKEDEENGDPANLVHNYIFKHLRGLLEKKTNKGARNPRRGRGKKNNEPHI